MSSDPDHWLANVLTKGMEDMTSEELGQRKKELEYLIRILRRVAGREDAIIVIAKKVIFHRTHPRHKCRCMDLIRNILLDYGIFDARK